MRMHLLSASTVSRIAVLLVFTAVPSARAALHVTAAERSVVAWAAGYDYEFDEIEADGASTLVPDGLFAASPAVDLDDYYGLDVAEGTASIDSEITSTTVRVAIAASGTVDDAATFQADGGGEGALHATVVLTAPTRVSFAAQGQTESGYVIASVSLRPEAGGSAIASGYLQAPTQFQAWFAGVLPAGTYVLEAELQAWAYGGAGSDDRAEGAIDLELMAYHVADVDMNGTVGFGDLTLMLDDWGACEGCPSDLDLDGATGFGDLGTLLAAWGE